MSDGLIIRVIPRSTIRMLCMSLLLLAMTGRSEPPAVDAVFADCRVRYPGSPGNLVLEEKVARRFAASGFQHGAIRFTTPVLRSGKTVLNFADHVAVPVVPMHPTVTRPGNFTERDFTTTLVYLGRCTPADLERLNGVPLAGAIGVAEFDCGERWQRWLRFGLRGFVFIGGATHSYPDAVGKIFGTEVSVPRFYVDAASGEMLRQRCDSPGAVRVTHTPSRWQNQTLRNLWVLVPGNDPELQQEVAVVTAPLDSNCIVPELGEGAQAAANLSLLLRLLDEFAARPPARPVLLAAVNAHTQAFAGERHLAWHLLFPDDVRERYRANLLASKRAQELYLQYYRQLNLSPPTNSDEQQLISFRTLTDKTTGKILRIKTPITTLATRDKNQLKAERFKLFREHETGKQQELDILDKRLRQHIRVLSLFNKVGVRTTLSELSTDEIAMLRGYVDEVVETYDTWSRLNQRELEQLDANDAVRDAMGGRQPLFVWVLNFTWTGQQIGFASCRGSKTGIWSRAWGKAFNRIAAALPGADLPGLLADTMTATGGLNEGYYWNDSGFADVLQPLQLARPTAAFVLRDIFVDRGRAFTPDDTFANLDTDKVTRFSDFVSDFLRAVLADREISAVAQVQTPNTNDWQPAGIQIKSFMFDPFAATTLPELPLPGTVVTVHGDLGRRRDAPLLADDIVRAVHVLTDGRAVAPVLGITRYREEKLVTNARHFDTDFTAIDFALDAGDVEWRMHSNISSADASHTLALFPCREVVVYERTNLSRMTDFPHLTDLNIEFVPLTGAQNDAPRKFGFGPGMICMTSAKEQIFRPGPVAFYFEPEMKFKLMTAEKYLALNAGISGDDGRTPQLGKGFADTAALGSDFHRRSAHDMAVLNRYRLSRFQGVKDTLAGYFLDRGEAALQHADAAFDRHHHAAGRRSVYEALGAERRAYQRIAFITNDMLTVIVFYMALLLPFCFFIQKLLFNFVRIEAQMVMFIVLFTGTYVLFRNIHPAFKVAQSPEAMFVAFVMAMLGIFVMVILHARFEGEMRLLLSSITTGAGEMSSSTASSTAMMLGVSNMKRRRVRTVLTTATILLITFTMLAFSSISVRLQPTLIARSGTPPYAGLMYQWLGTQTIYENTAQALNDILHGRGQVLMRRWLLPPPPGGPLAYRAFHISASTNQTVQIEALLGLDAGEDGFISAMPMLAGRFFIEGERDVAVLPFQVARALGIGRDNFADAAITFRGRRYPVIGILDSDAFRRIRDINGRTLLPVKPAPLADTASKNVNLAPASDDADLYYVAPSSLVLMPVATIGDLGGGPASISVKLAGADAWPLLDELLMMTDGHYFLSSPMPFKINAASDVQSRPGIYYVGAGHKTSIGGLASLLIPLLIGSTIILNTMLGSVFERKNEIAIYNAIGVNPRQIGLLFVAEAFVYGVIGAVGGYLIGQAASIFLSRLPFFAAINLNFSSLTVVYVIVVTIGVVMLSTLYPAYVATRTAVPSGKREWSLPEHDGQQMALTFPFVYTGALALGVAGYLHEYFAKFTEATIGDLIAQLDRFESVRDADGRDAYELHYHVALAPYDLGVTQQVVARIAFSTALETYQMHFHIERVSGQDSTWVATNRPFLKKLRKYLMAWRNLDRETQETYVQAAKERLGTVN